jgi:phage protein D
MSLIADSLNDARIPAGSVRQPRLLVSINGTPVTGFIEAEVTNASHFTADTFRAVAVSSGLPAQYGAAYWALSASDQIAISVGYADAGGNIGNKTQLILGQIDEVEYDPVRRTVTLTGRDLSAPLIDSKTAEKFQNQKSYQIAQTLAARHGLTASVQKTTALAGTYYDIDNVMLTQEQTEWDLLVYLAKQEGFDVWVSGQTLFFQPSPVATSIPYKLIAPPAGTGNVSSNAMDVKVSRSQTLARDVIVKIQSWNQKQQRSFVVTYKVSQAFRSQRSGGVSQTYSYVVPNLTRDQAFRLAKATAEDITRHERILTARLPGDNVLTTRTQVQLIGTGTAWDQNYYPDTVRRHISFESGYTMDLRAKNHSTQSTVVLG